MASTFSWRHFWINTSHNGGIDLYDSTASIELKSRYQRYSHSFAVDARQRVKFAEQNKEKHLFWAFLIYDISQSPRRIGMQYNIERFVTERDVWILPWEWIDQFPIATPKTGPYYYVHRSDFPTALKKYRRGNATLYLPPNSVLEDRLSRLSISAKEEVLPMEA